MSFSTRGRTQRGLPPPQPLKPVSTAPGARGVLHWLDRLFLGIPNEREPGALAVLVFFIRQYAFEGVALLLFTTYLLSGTNRTGGSGDLMRVLTFSPLIVFEELGRYSFVRRADRPLRALIVFTAPIVAISALVDRSDLLAFAWEAGWSLLASAALYWGLRHRPYLAYLTVGLIVAHLCVFEAMPRRAADPPHQANLAPVAPSISEMSASAKLYPGATINMSRSRKLLGLTSWEVEYAAHASPEEIDAFYQSVALSSGFTQDPLFHGLRTFERASTRDEFHYTIIVWPHTDGIANVSLTARTFGKPSAGP
jgi:hypothetical protein